MGINSVVIERREDIATITIITNRNREGIRVYKEKWKPTDYIKLQAYIGLLMLAGVYKSYNEAIENLWNKRKGQHIFHLTMSMKRFKIISRVIKFDNCSTRTHCRQTDKLAPIRELWDK